MRSIDAHKRAATRWLLRDPDAKTRASVARWLETNDSVRLEAAFGGRLAFGTAGLRARVGPGPLAMNALVVRETVAGLLAVLEADGGQRRPIAVGFDGRLDSERFAKEAVGVLLAAGWPVALFSRPVPTPLVGFWVQRARLAAGIVITASHNPKGDNGLKIYWRGGVQIAPPIDHDIAQAILAAAASETPVAWRSPTGSPELPDQTEEAMAAYGAALDGVAASWPQGQGKPAPVRVAYSPLHGVGLELTQRALAGAPNVSLQVVREQGTPDGYFPTIASPNPEDTASLDLAMALGESSRADLVCVHDPDADRLRVAARLPAGAEEIRPGTSAPLVVLSGDELGLILAHALLERSERPAEAIVASSLVSSRAVGELARRYGSHHVVTAPGFKWLARAAMAAKEAGQICLLAYEEALGYAPTSLVWDKDGVATLRLVVQLAATLAERGQTLLDALSSAAEQSCWSVTTQRTVQLAGQRAGSIMARLRQRAAAALTPFGLTAIDDGLALPAGHPLKHLRASDWLTFYCRPPVATEAGSDRTVRIIARGSGTEPKLKLYFEWLAAPIPKAGWWPARCELARALDHFAQSVLPVLMQTEE